MDDLLTQVAQAISDELGLTNRAFESAKRAARRALEVAGYAGLLAENERLSKAVCGGILGDLLKPDEAEALADFVKQLRNGAALSQPLGSQGGEK